MNEKIRELVKNSAFYSMLDILHRPEFHMNDALLAKYSKDIVEPHYRNGGNKNIFAKLIKHEEYQYCVYWRKFDIQLVQRSLAKLRFANYGITQYDSCCLNHTPGLGNNPRQIVDDIYIAPNSREVSFSDQEASAVKLSRYYDIFKTLKPVWVQFRVGFCEAYFHYIAECGLKIPDELKYIELIISCNDEYKKSFEFCNYINSTFADKNITIARVFDDDVLLYYAYESAKGSYNFLEDIIFVEVLPSRNNNQTIFATNLTNVICPIIRYPLNNYANIRMENTP